MTELAAIRGFKDILPDQARYWRLIEDRARDVSRRFNYAELRPPIMERTELFQRGLGEATDIVEKEMYTMEDRSGDRITLRPEATAGMVRALIEHNLHEGGRPVRLFCLGPMFRYERPQKGRLRQFHQLDVEVFGDSGPTIDAEVIMWLHTFLKELGLIELTVVLNSLGCPACRPRFREKLVDFLADHQKTLCQDCNRRLTQNPLRVLDCKSPSCQAIVSKGPVLSEFLCPECRQHFLGVRQALDSLGVIYTLNDKLVRGLDYYTRTTFEVHSGNLGSQNAVAGGGRYDGLCARLGGPDIPAIGFAAGLERLILLLSEKYAATEPGPDYYAAVLCPEATGPAFTLVQHLRAMGHMVAADWEPGGLKSRLKRADKAGAAKVIMFGPDELAAGEVTVRDLSTGDQWRLPINRPERF
ncbi:MAG: histidine--tRNA ligase [Deltaproteobacteria bacterium]|jgi:histidyl-tRNA synthetase|nr:histidine--tRNA ligase [Deltaproteobacteria bacterium]